MIQPSGFFLFFFGRSLLPTIFSSFFSPFFFRQARHTSEASVLGPPPRGGQSIYAGRRSVTFSSRQAKVAGEGTKSAGVHQGCATGHEKVENAIKNAINGASRDFPSFFFKILPAHFGSAAL